MDIKKSFLPHRPLLLGTQKRVELQPEFLYKSIGISKQSFHQHIERYLQERCLEEQILLLVYQVREDHPIEWTSRCIINLCPKASVAINLNSSASVQTEQRAQTQLPQNHRQQRCYPLRQPARRIRNNPHQSGLAK